jgi:hypothetical protein
MNTLFDLDSIEITEKQAPKRQEFVIQVSDFEGNSFFLKRESNRDFYRWWVLDSGSRKKPSRWKNLKTVRDYKFEVISVLSEKYDKESVRIVVWSA